MLPCEIEWPAIAVIIASVAALFSGYQALLSRKHNRLSVKPHLTTSRYGVSDKDKYTLTFCLENNGLGPAIIFDYNVFFDDKKIGDNYNNKDLQLAIETKIQNQKNIRNNTIMTLGLESAFPSGRKETLLAIHVDKTLNFDEELYQKFLDRFDLEIIYKSIYNEKFSLSTKDD